MDVEGIQQPLHSIISYAHVANELLPRCLYFTVNVLVQWRFRWVLLAKTDIPRYSAFQLAESYIDTKLN